MYINDNPEAMRELDAIIIERNNLRAQLSIIDMMITEHKTNATDSTIVTLANILMGATNVKRRV